MALMVIAVHADFLADIDHTLSHLLLNGVFRIAVPTFFIINGYYFYSTVRKGRELAWFKRITILWVIWTVIYFRYWAPQSSLDSVLTLLEGHLHLWYVQNMIGGGLVLLFLDRFGYKVQLAAAIAFFLTGVSIQYIGFYELLGPTPLNDTFNHIPVYRNFITTGFPYLCIGYLINHFKIQERLNRSQILGAVIVGFGLILFEATFNLLVSAKAKGLDCLFSPVITSPALFLLLMKIDIKGNSKAIAVYSSGIYFVHLLVLWELEARIELTPTPLTLLTIVVCIPVVFVLAKVNERLKYLL